MAAVRTAARAAAQLAAPTALGSALAASQRSGCNARDDTPAHATAEPAQRSHPASYVCGGEHSLAVSRGQCFSAGACGLGWSRLKDITPELFVWRRAHTGERIASVTGGYYHSLAIGSSGDVYAWGCGAFTDGNNDGVIPALGQPDSLEETLEPTKVALPGRAAAAAAGAYHSVVLTEDGAVYTFGAAQLGQLGRKTTTGTDSAGLPVDARPRSVEGLPGPALGVGVAFYSTFARCQDGVYGAGENQYQQLGAGPKNIRTMTRISELDGESIAEVAGGYCHTLCRTADGRVLGLGAGDDGQRGDGLTEGNPVVSLVNLPVGATSVAAGANHSLALGLDGNAYAWGSNEHGELGLGDDVDGAATPVRIPRPPDGIAYTAVSAGYAHSVLTDELGRAWAFGLGDSGQLARGDDGDASTPVRCLPTEAH